MLKSFPGIEIIIGAAAKLPVKFRTKDSSVGAMLDLIGGSVAYSFDTTTGTLPLIKTADVKADHIKLSKKS